MAKPDFLGQGWKFPLAFSHGGCERSAGLDNIEESIWLILGTGRGERVMRPTFGSGLNDLVFSPDSSTTRGAIIDEVKRALVLWEPRITVLSVTVDGGEPGTLIIDIRYQVRATNSVYNLVFPFHLTGGL